MSPSNLFQNARTEYLDVLTAQHDLRDARVALIDTKERQLTAVVNAYQALGGGNLLANPPRAGHPRSDPAHPHGLQRRELLDDLGAVLQVRPVLQGPLGGEQGDRPRPRPPDRRRQDHYPLGRRARPDLGRGRQRACSATPRGVARRRTGEPAPAAAPRPAKPVRGGGEEGSRRRSHRRHQSPRGLAEAGDDGGETG